MKRFQRIAVGLLMTIGLVGWSPVAVGAVNVFKACGGGAPAGTAVCKDTGNTGDSMIKNAVNLLLYALGIISVIAIIAGGIRFATSSGNASSVNTAREAIIYGVVGVVVGLLAWSIVNFVVGSF